MTRLEYRVIQYFKDPAVGEGRNLGVVVHDGRRAALKLSGLDLGGEVDTSVFRAIDRKNGGQEWIYAEWACWFQALIDQEGASQSRLWEALDRLGSGNPEWAAATEGSVEVEDSGMPAIDQAVNDLFKRMVTAPKRTCDWDNAKWGDPKRIIQHYKLDQRPDYAEDLVVDFFDDKDPAGMAKFDFAFTGTEERPRTAIRVIRGQQRKTFSEQVAASAFMFQQAQAFDFVDKRGSLTLIRPAKRRRGVDLASLERFSEVVVLDSEAAAKRVAEVIKRAA